MTKQIARLATAFFLLPLALATTACDPSAAIPGRPGASDELHLDNIKPLIPCDPPATSWK